jgi:cell wall assembly regulator SMI1
MRDMPPPYSSVQAAWARIDAWLQTHAPVSFALLAPPAAAGAIASAQAEMGMLFPVDLLESLACHDGVTAWCNILPGQPPLPVADMVKLWRSRVRIDEEDDELFGDDELWWHRQWIPWAASDSDADVIDMRPGPNQARLGKAPHADTAHFHDGWPSLVSYLSEVADALESGREVRDWTAYLTPQRELWWSFPGETEVNGDPLTPAPATPSDPQLRPAR